MDVLCNIEDYDSTIKDLRLEWVLELLVRLGLEEQHLLAPESDETLKAMKLKRIEVFDEVGTEKIDVVYEGELIAQWKAPQRRRIKEKNGEEYYHIRLNYWSSIDMDFGESK